MVSTSSIHGSANSGRVQSALKLFDDRPDAAQDLVHIGQVNVALPVNRVVHEAARRGERRRIVPPQRVLRQAVLLGEVTISEPRRLVRYFGDSEDELHMVFDVPFWDCDWSAPMFREAIATVDRLVRRRSSVVDKLDCFI